VAFAESARQVPLVALVHAGGVVRGICDLDRCCGEEDGGEGEEVVMDFVLHTAATSSTNQNDQMKQINMTIIVLANTTVALGRECWENPEPCSRVMFSLSKVRFLSIKIVEADHRKLTVSTNFSTDIFDGKVSSKLLTQQVNVDRKFLTMQVVRRSGFPLERDYLSTSRPLDRVLEISWALRLTLEI